MIKTQIQIPDDLYWRVKKLAAQREWSFAEVARRGLEYVVSVYPEETVQNWELPLTDNVERTPVSILEINRVREEELDAS